MLRINVYKIIIILPVFLFSNILAGNKKLTEVYVAIYKNIAVSEMRKTGIPASIKLAQGILESDLGRSDLAYKANNHFGIKCGKDWTGNIFYKHDDDLDSSGMVIESCFRAFSSPEESFAAHSDFLTDPSKLSRYGFLFALGSTDYAGWANGLKFSGYASDPTYASKLIRIIENNKLYLYDEPVALPKQNIDVPVMVRNDVIEMDKTYHYVSEVKASDIKYEKAKTSRSTRYNFLKINDLKALYAKGDETAQEIASRTGKDVFEILEFNEGISSPDDVFEQGEIIFLEKKKKSFNDENNGFHTVEGNETMYDISQKYGIRLESLLAKNNLNINVEPLSGEKISLIKNLSKKETPKHRIVEKFESYVDLGGLK
ncbi:MAG: glucosaminidase domain-containing protein [Saprospiraceae bacterium]|nr:glucosaminidase domain-containing protein [Saprospiraceae bacterium]